MLIHNISISVVVTVKNDEAGVKRLLEDLDKQTVKPDEVIIVRSEEYGNCTRGRGRNIGIKMAKNEFIAVTDVGCRPSREWLEKIDGQMVRMAEMARKAERLKGQAVVVAGWYRAVTETPWQKVFLPYLVPRKRFYRPDPRLRLQNDTINYLPASRSIAFTKKAWDLIGGYPEDPVSGGEDLKFADNLYQNSEINIIFEPTALVDWPAPLTLVEFIKDMTKHTRGNFEAGYWPHIIRNLSVVGRWAIMAVWPWVIPVYLIIAGLYKGRAFGYKGPALWMIMVKVAADAAVVYGVIIGIIDWWVIRKLRLKVLDG